MTDTSTVAALAEAHRRAQQQASAALVARDAAVRAAMAAGRSATVLSREVGVHRVQIYRVRDTGPDLEQATHYETRDEAIAGVIIEAVEAGQPAGEASAQYDVEAIAVAVLGDQELGYACLVTADELRAVVAASARCPDFAGGHMSVEDGGCKNSNLMNGALPDPSSGACMRR